MQLDATTYLKTKWPIGRGYDKRSGATRPNAIIIHSTNGNKGSTFGQEANFLRNSADVSAHYLVGKSGQVVCVVPDALRAWHSGAVVPSVFSNNTSIGIECHFTPGETFPRAGIDALTELVCSKVAQYGIPLANVDMHRMVARPFGRKVDPSFWTDAQFYAWRETLSGCVPVHVPTMPPVTPAGEFYTVKPGGGTLRTTPFRNAANIKRSIPAGASILIVGTAQGEKVLDSTVWLQAHDGAYLHSSAATKA